MNCQKCGHPQSAHIYLEGACRPGFVCPCDHYVPPRDPGMVQETSDIIPLKSMDPDVSEILERLIQETGLDRFTGEDRGTFEADYGLLKKDLLELKTDLSWALDWSDDSGMTDIVNESKRIRKKWGLS